MLAFAYFAKKLSQVFLVNLLLVYGLLMPGHLLSTSPFQSNSIGYDLGKPDKTLVLPGMLAEISGVSVIDQNTVGCIQDEEGIIFVYDIAGNKIKELYNFGQDGDYEDIVMIGKSAYILRSDGFIFEIDDYTLKNFKLKTYDTGIPSRNNEGLCHDIANNRLLISSKTKIPKEHEMKDMRFVYAFDLKTKKTSSEPLYSFDVQAIRKFAGGKDSNKVGSKKKGDPDEIKFFPSGIAIHPITKSLYVLSAVDHMLFIFDQGSLKQIEKLDHKIFNQPEGITFMKNGDMLISNEGRNIPATLLKFNYLN